MSVTAVSDLQFLAGGGEMGELTREKDWSETPLGDPESWPQSLRTTVSIILNSKFPMFLWWGSELICFYNDAYRPSLGSNGKHPSILGMKAEDAWPEIWDIIKPLIDQVLNGEGSVWSENQLVPIFRNGKIEDVYWTFSYSPVNDETDKIAGVLVTCTETTDKINTLKKLEESENLFRSVVEQSINPIVILKGEDFKVETANEPLFKVWGVTKDAIGKNLLDVLPEMIDQPFLALLKGVLHTGVPYYGYGQPAQFKYANGEMQTVYFDFVYQPLRESDGTITGVLVSAIDVTQKALADSALEETGKQFSILANNIQNLAWMADAEGAIYWYNQQWYDYTGTTAEEMEGWGWKSVHHPEHLPVVLERWQNSIQSGEPFEMVFPIKGADDKFRPFLTRIIPMHDQDGKVTSWIGTNTDISHQKEAEERISESADRLRLVLESLPQMAWTTLPNGETNYFSRSWYDYTGQTAAEALGYGWTKAIHPDFAELTLKEWSKSLREQIPVELETKVKRALDNEYRWVWVKGSPIKNEQGEIALWVGTVTDIDERKKFAEELKESEQKFRLLADAMPQHIWTSGTDGNLNYFNRSVYDYSGLTPEQIDKDGWIQIVHPDDREENIKQWTNSIATGKDFLLEHRFRRHDGMYRWMLSRAIPQKDEAGKIQMWVGTSTDIQDIKELDQQKDSFLSMASHELKTPVTTIKAYGQIAEAMLTKTGDTATLAIVNKMGTQVNRLTNLIADLLDITRIQKGKLQYHEAFFDVNEVVNDVVNDMQRTSTTHRIQNNAGDDVKIYGDKEKISQVLNNLISNAIKYSPQADKIKVSTQLKDNGVELSVQDFGIGIPAKEQQHVFEQFYRVTGNNQSTFPGMGIGLFICSEITKMHGGKIWADSVMGKGSTFHIWLPVDHREVK